MNPTYNEKEKIYRTSARYNFFGHYYLGFEGKKCSQMMTDDKQNAIDECAWVWGVREKKWIKKPEAPKAAAQ